MEGKFWTHFHTNVRHACFVILRINIIQWMLFWFGEGRSTKEAGLVKFDLNLYWISLSTISLCFASPSNGTNEMQFDVYKFHLLDAVELFKENPSCVVFYGKGRELV
ncbi:hypothetical protein TNCT_589011 [Trichonephila clavata]|uniref:Uncharacterized protein n=1 Tax=Trichonephila clavata TaxID=2740835 RepID=A0A8X6KL96_TRICU|nr:hypothetical protein TNCT_589011 [Trichonephila clavata]